MAVRVEPFFVGGVVEAADAIIARALSGDGGYACLANVHVLVTADRNATVQEALDDAWVVFPDGWPVAWLQRRLGAGDATRVPGPDLMPTVFDRGRNSGLRHFLFGSSEDVLAELERKLNMRFPGAIVAGRYAPGFGRTSLMDTAAAEAEIRAAGAHVVWCALGAPKQEIWMRGHASAIAPAVVVGVGAAFDFLAETKDRAPAWMRHAGLEWLHRLITEPFRLAPRYLTTNARFIFRAVPRALLTRGRA